MSRSTAALLIAIMFHILLILLFDFLMRYSPQPAERKQEHRIKVALKEQPQKSAKTAAVNNKLPPVTKAPPLPKGKQLKTPTPPAKKQTENKPAVAKTVQKPLPEKTQEKPDPTKKAYKHVQKVVNKDINISKTPVKKGLYAMLSKKQKSKTEVKKSVQKGTHIGSDFKEAYGEAFGKLSEGEKQYIVDNQEIMRRITQEQLNRLGPVNIPRNLNVNAINIVEFYLHPNGDISELRIVDQSGYQILDDTSLQTIEYSYHRYPLPKQKTLVRYKVGYYLGH